MDGNPNLDQPKKKNLALIVGLAVGIPIFLLLVIAVIIIVYFSKRKPPAPSPVQATELQMGETNQNENTFVTVTTEAMVKPNSIEQTTLQSEGESFTSAPNGTHANMPIHANGYSAEISGEDISSNINSEINNHQLGVQDIDEEELNDLLRQHGSTGANVRT